MLFLRAFCIYHPLKTLKLLLIGTKYHKNKRKSGQFVPIFCKKIVTLSRLKNCLYDNRN